MLVLTAFVFGLLLFCMYMYFFPLLLELENEYLDWLIANFLPSFNVSPWYNFNAVSWWCKCGYTLCALTLTCACIIADVDGKVVHVVQRPPPMSMSTSTTESSTSQSAHHHHHHHVHHMPPNVQSFVVGSFTFPPNIQQVPVCQCRSAACCESSDACFCLWHA